jgi:hypothetical protein
MELYAAFCLGLVVGWLLRHREVRELRDCCGLYEELLTTPNRGREGAQ